MSDPAPAATARPETLEVLTEGTLELEGRLITASNASFVGVSTLDGVSLGCVYKPVRGERPLWDFPDGTLARRERAAYLVSQGTGWGLVPPTVLRDGPFGPGMCQLWIDVATGEELVDIVPFGAVPPGWMRILDAEDQYRQPVSLVHADVPALRRMCALDAVINNADRKGGHVLVGPDGAILGVDHGVCFHVQAKLRTVLWGWADEPLPADCQEGLARLLAALDGRSGGSGGRLAEQLRDLLSGTEVAALHRRTRQLRRRGRFPMPSQAWPAIPWPAF
ncbi:MAG: SCO1664 family protein [Actinomycetota bacterium]|nr:SCO1664 family protein [Actinomycetota bacterium]